MDDLLTYPLTLVIAPAGVGKTSLLAGWAAAAQVPTAWLTIDETDRDGVQLWTGIVAALEPVISHGADHALDAIRRPRTQPHAVGAILADLERLPREPMVLILDDVHLLDEDPVQADLLATFLQHLPPWLHAVLLGRRTPRLPIDRLRARGQLGEIHLPELRFSDDEAMSLLSKLTPSMPGDQRVRVVRHADGWAAGLQFAALAFRSSQARTDQTAGDRSDELMQHYVRHEVLAAERSDVVDVLRDTAVVDRINPSLASALTLRTDAGDLLNEAEGRGLFVTRLDPLGGWLGIHALIREMLLAEISSTQPGRLERQHARAARWFEAAGEDASALDHWLLAGQPREALRLLAAVMAQLYDSGREATISRVLAEIPPAVAYADLDAMLEYAWCHLLVDRRRFLDAVEQAVELASSVDGIDAIPLGRTSMLQSVAATMTGDWVEGAHHARRAISHLGPRSWMDPLGRFAGNMIARDIALSERWDDATDDVAQTRTSVSHDPDRRLAFEGTRALGLALGGQPLDSLRVVAGVRDAARVDNLTLLRGELEIAEVIAQRELGDPNVIAELTALTERTTEPQPYAQLLALLELTHAWLDRGDPERALSVFRRAEALVTMEALRSGSRSWLARSGTVVALARGDVTSARGYADKVDDPFWTPVSSARISLVEGDREAARATLEAAVPRCPRHEVVRSALLSRTVDRRDDAAKSVTTAVEVASNHGMLQTLVTEGPEVLGLLELAAWRAPEAWLGRVRRAGAADVHRSSGGSPDLMHLLTDREREVLRLLPSRLTLGEIAGELFVSINTLKFHLKVIYRKLEVNSRAEAARLVRASSGVGEGHKPKTFER